VNSPKALSQQIRLTSFLAFQIQKVKLNQLLYVLIFLLLLFRMYIFGGWVPHKGENVETSPHDCEWRCTSSFSYLNLGESFKSYSLR
jgi:hypothetical protein